MTEEQACQRAIQMGIREIAFTNHIMPNYPDYTVSLEDFARHWDSIQGCQQRYPQLTIRLGIEMDYYQGQADKIAHILQSYENAIGRPFDIILGSVHELHGILFSSARFAPQLFNGCDLKAVYHDYFALVTEAVQSRLYDVMAHLDVIKKFTYELNPPLRFESYRDAVEPLVDALVDLNVGVEMNTKGLAKKIAEPFPSKELLSLYLSRVKASNKQPVITLGSDAHVVGDVGGFIREGALILKEAGFKGITKFEKRHIIN
jgi:histidinol-phosphatase (PHP family)